MKSLILIFTFTINSMFAMNLFHDILMYELKCRRSFVSKKVIETSENLDENIWYKGYLNGILDMIDYLDPDDEKQYESLEFHKNIRKKLVI